MTAVSLEMSDEPNLKVTKVIVVSHGLYTLQNAYNKLFTNFLY